MLQEATGSQDCPRTLLTHTGPSPSFWSSHQHFLNCPSSPPLPFSALRCTDYLKFDAHSIHFPHVISLIPSFNYSLYNDDAKSRSPAEISFLNSSTVCLDVTLLAIFPLTCPMASSSPHLALLPCFLIQWKELSPVLQVPKRIQASPLVSPSYPPPDTTYRVHVSSGPKSSQSHPTSPLMLLILISDHYHLSPGYYTSISKKQTESLCFRKPFNVCLLFLEQFKRLNLA